MRTTISLPPSLHAILSSLAHHAGRSLNDTMVELIEKGLSAPSTPCTGEPAAVYRIDATTGLPVTRHSRVITPEDVARLEDEA